jgi:ABC-type branched-subunit amino acid transport system ATPase component
VVQSESEEAFEGLSVDDLTVRFGGLVAVDAVTVKAPTGQCTGLIGPNGAGKTTTFNACSGLIAPSSGRIGYSGTDITGMSPSRRAQLGLGRTFQRMELWDSLSVRENVGVGREARFAGANPLRHVWRQRNDQAAIDEAAAVALEVCGIADLARARPSELSTGQRRLVELARAIAAGFDMLLLDEPSSGLDRSETEHFGRILLDLVAGRGTGILLVEHDMTLVMSVCAYIYVLDFGKPLFEGTPREVASSRAVQSAYLGSEVIGVAADV